MRIFFYSPNRIEPWDYRNVFEKGIGGSETSHVEMAVRLAARGHDVTSFTDLPPDCPGTEFRGVHWRDLEDADLSLPGLWIVYRRPSAGKLFQWVPGQVVWLICQDVYYHDWDSAAVARFNRVVGLCPMHLAEIADRDKSPSLKLHLSSNGVNVERIERVEREAREPCMECGAGPEDADRCPYCPTPIPRDPRRLIWASSPDRGLKEMLDIFERAREQVPGLNLHVFYGMDNIEMICGGDRNRMPWRKSWEQYDRACAMEGVTWHGRIGQDQLAREWLSSGIWLYPTWFSETSCISCMEAQASGAIPITNPIWATGYNVRHGIFVHGAPSDPLVKTRYVQAVVDLATHPDAQETIRREMMPEARHRLTWERFAEQWDGWAKEDLG